jgi:hypothetical protein
MDVLTLVGCLLLHGVMFVGLFWLRCGLVEASLSQRLTFAITITLRNPDKQPSLGGHMEQTVGVALLLIMDHTKQFIAIRMSHMQIPASWRSRIGLQDSPLPQLMGPTSLDP